MIRTRVGYTGGSTVDPTYHNLADHTEAIQIDYDPSQISYEDLLKVFFAKHNPVYPSFARQYMSAIYCHNKEQEQVARQTMKNEKEKRETEIYTEISTLSKFYLAEDYHQKYYLQNTLKFMKPMSKLYPVVSEMVDSTVAARVNGFIRGEAKISSLKEVLDTPQTKELWKVVLEIGDR